MTFAEYITPIVNEPGVANSFFKTIRAKDAIDVIYFSLGELNPAKNNYFWENFDTNKFCKFVAYHSKTYQKLHPGIHVSPDNAPSLAHCRIRLAFYSIAQQLGLNINLSKTDSQIEYYKIREWSERNWRKFLP